MLYVNNNNDKRYAFIIQNTAIFIKIPSIKIIKNTKIYNKKTTNDKSS